MSVVHVTKNNFQAEVMESEKPVLVDFFADWCGPCQMLAPLLNEIAEEHQEIKVCKINIEEEMELARKYRVMSIPTLIVVKNGEITNRTLGAMPKEEILQLL